MKKSQRIRNAIFKMGYAITVVSVIARYISEIISPTATYSRNAAAGIPEKPQGRRAAIHVFPAVSVKKSVRQAQFI